MSPIDVGISEDLGIDVRALSGVTQDSRKVKDGYLFAALQGAEVDGRDYIDDALERGASVILSDDSVCLESNAKAVLITTVEPPRSFSHIVSEFYQKQPEHIIAVTGTNGKSSVVHFADQLLRALNEDSTFIGTLSGSMTTPDPVSLHSLLAKLSEEGITHVALEASSHGLAQYRMDGVRVGVAAFTSFSQDHLDYHLDMYTYLSAKSRLFSDILMQEGVAVLNADVAEYGQILSICQKRCIRILSYGEKGHDIKIISRSISGASQQIEVEVLGHNYCVDFPLVGYFQVMNALCAMACVIAQDVENEERTNKLVAALAELKGVPGRMQHVSSPDAGFHAYIDYAHTPDALENVLKSLRPHTEGRIISVFGCGGDRDQEKRSLMGEIASRLADIVIVTDDNPRSESPSVIRKQIISGAHSGAENIHEIAGRHEAIEFGVSLQERGDILLVAGKGHEQGQIFDGVTKPFDDVSEVKRAFEGIS